MDGVMRQPINTASLSAYLTSYVPEIALPIDVSQFSYGQSNPTYQLSARDGSKYVLRKKPPGTLLSKTAHRIDREHRIIRALAGTKVPVPRTYCLCENTEVLGTAFYIMEYLDGRIFEDASFPGVSERERTQMWRDAVQVLARLHGIQPDSVGLADYGKASGFYNRQLKTLSAISASQAGVVDVETGRVVGKLPHFNETVTFLGEPANQPSSRSTLIHGDFKIDNLVYHKTKPEVIGILDWEMSTVGHPLSDLSNLLSPYTFAIDPPNNALSSRVNEAFLPSADAPGLPSQAQCLAWYTELGAWDPTQELAWGNIFAAFRNAVIMQGIAARWAQRQASSQKAGEIGSLMGSSGDFYWGLLERWRKGRLRAKTARL